MLDQIWQLLMNFGLDVHEIGDSIRSLIEVDEKGNIVGGLLQPIANLPLVGGILGAFGDFAPDSELTTKVVETTAETIL